MNLQLKGCYVIVKTLEQENVTSSGLILPNIVQKDTYTGEVVALGEGTLIETFEVVDNEVKRVFKPVPIDPEVAVGSIVLFPKWAGQELVLENTKYLLLRAYDLLAVIE